MRFRWSDLPELVANAMLSIFVFQFINEHTHDLLISMIFALAIFEMLSVPNWNSRIIDGVEDTDKKLQNLSKQIDDIREAMRKDFEHKTEWKKDK